MSRRKPRTARSQRSHRRRSAGPDGPIWLYGLHTVAAALANPARDCSRLLVTDATHIDRLLENAGDRPNLNIDTVSREAFTQMTGLSDDSVHQGVALLANLLPSLSLDDVITDLSNAENARLVVLDQVSDPHNIGAIVRTAAAFGARAVIVQDRHSPPVTGSLAKAASGGLEACHLVRVTNIARALEQLKKAGVWCLGLDGATTQNLRKAAVSGPLALVLGAEGTGLRRLTAENCDALARIPQTGAVASLNVSNAAAIALYELSRPAE